MRRVPSHTDTQVFRDDDRATLRHVYRHAVLVTESHHLAWRHREWRMSLSMRTARAIATMLRVAEHVRAAELNMIGVGQITERNKL
ncbi:MAG: hypothetical protein KatS3mg038_1443 [Candidatus Kapaibacterium sp.]|nr:MAG: hypothetical protein KatS3mg038_1443 [Candidatus Kapabacteria bacterium]